MFNGFNFNEENFNENHEQDEIQYTELDVDLKDPDEMVAEYLEDLKQASSEEELIDLLYDFMIEVSMNAQKEVYLDAMQSSIAQLQMIQFNR